MVLCVPFSHTAHFLIGKASDVMVPSPLAGGLESLQAHGVSGSVDSCMATTVFLFRTSLDQFTFPKSHGIFLVPMVISWLGIFFF